MQQFRESFLIFDFYLMKYIVSGIHLEIGMAILRIGLFVHFRKDKGGNNQTTLVSQKMFLEYLEQGIWSL